MRFIDIHTHRKESPPSRDAIVNLQDDGGKTTAAGFYSAGLHPWFLQKNTLDADLLELHHAARNPRVIAIGECGLDSSCDTDMDLQQQAFSEQLMLAGALQKPVIVHCVRAFSETLQLLKDLRTGVSVIFHGYRKSPDLAKKILSGGHYLSFGHSLTLADPQKILRQIPTDRLFLETDQSTLPIQAIYTAAAGGLDMNLETLCQRIEKNAAAVFGDKFCPHE